MSVRSGALNLFRENSHQQQTADILKALKKSDVLALSEVHGPAIKRWAKEHGYVFVDGLSVGGELMELAGLTADAAEALTTVGEISPIVTTEKGFHLLRLKAQTPARSLPLDDVKAQIRNRLFSERRTAASDELMNRLKAQSGFTLDEAAEFADASAAAGASRVGT